MMIIIKLKQINKCQMKNDKNKQNKCYKVGGDKLS